jgi:Carboxypeptidase regulatory-like domain
MNPLRQVAAIALLVFILSSPAAWGAQASGNGGTIQGVVTDPSKAVIAGAEVTLTNAVTGYKQTVKTGPDGAFRLVNIPPNQYQIQVVLSGFQPFTKDIAVRSPVPVVLNVAMALANSAETVTVEASSNNVLENVPTPHTDVDQSLLTNLPISSNGQGLSDAITLTAGGVVADSNGFFHPQGDHGETSYVIDGQPITDQQNKNFSTQFPPDAFQSLELVTGAPGAQYGDKTSLIVNATTRSGMGLKPSVTLDTYYGSFGTFGEDATFGIGGTKWGNFVALNTGRSGRFLDSPEFTPFHDKGNNTSFFDRLDFQPTNRDSLHLNLFAARNWFQVPNTYDQLAQDQRQQTRTINIAPGYQHTFNAQTLLTVNPFFRQDRIGYYPSADPFDDSPATLSQHRRLTNWGARADLAYSSGIHNLQVGTELMRTRLNENFALGITDPDFNPVCLSAAGDPLALPTVTNPNSCAGLGYIKNPNLSTGLIPFDLTRGGSLFRFQGNANIDEEAVYAQDQLTIRRLTLNLGLRFDNYDGISSDKLLQPRIGLSYLLTKTGTVLRGAYSRTMETPYNENLVLSSTTGAGGLASNVFGAFGGAALRAGHRNQFNVGFQQTLKKYVQIDADYFWKFTKNAFDFDTLFNSPVEFPIEWRLSKIDGFSLHVSTTNWHGIQAFTTMGHTRARFFGPETGGIIFNSPLNNSVFRIDHDQAFQQTTYLRYQYKKYGPWFTFTWRYDSGEVAGAVGTVEDVLALTPAQQAAVGVSCGSQVATVYQGISSCAGGLNVARVRIPAPDTENADRNPPRIAPRNLFDIAVGSDNLFHKEKWKTMLKFTAVNITNEVALYNFLSTFSGTHWVTPRSYQITLGWSY